MKKFFSKKWTLISFATALVVFVGGLLAILLSPVFYLGSYSGGGGDGTYTYTNYIHFKSCKKYEVKRDVVTDATGEMKTTVKDYWYYRQGDIVFALGSVENMTEEQYKEAVEELKKLEGAEYDAVVKLSGSKISCFNMRIEDEGGSVGYGNDAVFPILITDAVLATLALVGTGLSTFFFIKERKKNPEPATEN